MHPREPWGSAPQAYQVITAAALVEAGLASVEQVCDGARIVAPPTAYGDRDADLVRQGWHDVVDAGPVLRFEFRDAVVHGNDGVITLGRFVVAETLLHVWPLREGAWREGDLFILAAVYPTLALARAEHLQCGNSGNYFHWLLDGFARCTLASAEGPLLMPWTALPFQRQGPALLPGLDDRTMLLGARQSIQVARLGWVTSLTGAGTAFHPALERLRRAGPPGGAGARDIYVSRADATNRRLRNEAELEAACVASGFVPLRLAELSLAEQAAAFATARRIVAPHGAGLSNLVWCRPGAAVLELQMDVYLNWCFRRLSATLGLRYGCLVGEAQSESAWVHYREWSLDAGRLRAVLDDPGFRSVP